MLKQRTLKSLTHAVGVGLHSGQRVEITTAGIRESHVHDVQITKEAPNYRAE